jgi:hypothetical protein
LVDLILEVTSEKAVLITQVRQPVPSPLRVKGLIDTGSTGVAVDYMYAAGLGLQPTDYTAYLMAGTQRFAPAISAKLTLVMEPTSFCLESQKCVVFMNLETPEFGVLIGLDVLQHFLLYINGPNKRSMLLMPGIPRLEELEDPKLSAGAAYYDPTKDRFRRWDGTRYVTYRPKRSLWRRLRGKK